MFQTRSLRARGSDPGTPVQQADVLPFFHAAQTGTCVSSGVT